jgi:site-specific recombinase XerD
MNTTEIATRTPERALLLSDFSTNLSARRGMSDRTNDAHRGDVHGLSGDAHTLRHTVAAALPEGGTETRSTQELSRHAALAMTLSYPHQSPERRRPAAAHVHPRT